MDQFAGLLIGDFSRITEPGENVFVLVEIFDGGFVGDGEDDLVAALFGLTEFPELRSRRCLGQRFVITIDVLGVGELTGFARDAAEKFERRGDGIGRGHVVHELSSDAGILEVFVDEPGVLFIHFLRHCGRGDLGLDLFALGAGRWRGGNGREGDQEERARERDEAG